MSDPARLCGNCGLQVDAEAKVCGRCGQPLGLRWVLRGLRRGLLIGLIIPGCLAGFVGLRVFLEKGLSVNQTVDELEAAVTGAERACAARGCPPEIIQAKALYEKARKQTVAGKFQEAAKSIKSARELLARGGQRSTAAAKPVSASTAAVSDMVEIPAGEFMMGSFDVGSDHHPLHPVSLRAYSIGAREVTVEEYRRYCREVQLAFPDQPAGSTSRHPAALVTWPEAKAFCEHLGRRLPTEAEWEKAARCGLAGKILVGTDREGLGRLAWHGGNSGGKTHAVGTKAPSPCSLYDLFGNTAEWVSDWYAPDYYKTSPAQDPAGPEQGDDKVIRGGAFNSPVESLSASGRDKAAPESGRADIGFRCAKGS
ncbi:MAG: SUMF1/EgtB/PvdO family nonheme iron enzyme [Elusimicrobia bacterium]|nr:SUMF1/EgtB/PvdO family nonheme iron enzyme [Elusimicrobiota bacterium]